MRRAMRRLGLLVAFVAANAGCDTDDFAPCGPFDTAVFNGTNATELDANQMVLEAFSGLNGTERFYRWEVLALDVCPAEHAQASVSLMMETPVTTHPFEITAKASWGAGLYEQNIPVSLDPFSDDDFWFGSTLSDGGIGLKQVYGDGPALYLVQLRLAFETFGSAEADNNFVKENVSLVIVRADWKEFKEQGGANPVAAG